MKTNKSFVRFRESISVKGVEYQIIQMKDVKDDDGNIVAGLHDHVNKIIYFDIEMTTDEKRQTFLHEFFHAYLYECHIREGLDGQLEETIVEALSQAMVKEFVIRWKK